MLNSQGYVVIDEYMSKAECDLYLDDIAAYRASHQLPEIDRPAGGRPLRYKVIDGNAIQAHLPRIWRLYTEPMLELASDHFGQQLVPLDNLTASVNVNIMEPVRSTYRWHYDRTLVTILLYLTEVKGGETEMYPNYRIMLDQNRLRAQRWLDRVLHFPPIRALFSRKIEVAPIVGRLLLMRANRAWHSVRANEGPGERINIVLAYDLPGAQHQMAQALDQDIYTQAEHDFVDPNYGV